MFVGLKVSVKVSANGYLTFVHVINRLFHILKEKNLYSSVQIAGFTSLFPPKKKKKVTSQFPGSYIC